METKFTALVKIRKQKVLECQREIIQKNYEIATSNERCEAIKDEIGLVKIPENGTFKEILQAQEIKRIHHQELERTRLRVEWLKSQKIELEKVLKELMAELEKAKHLDDLEIEKALKESKKRELSRINEVATILFNSKSRRVE